MTLDSRPADLTHYWFPEVIDSTMLASMRCPRKFFLNYVQRIRPAGGTNIHLTAGGAYAKGLEVARRAYLAGTPPEACLEKGIEALIEAYGDADPGTSAKSLDRMCGALEFYFSEYPLDSDPARIATPGGIPAIEWSFALPLPFNHPSTGQPILYCGRTDLLVEFAGALYGEDDKTTSQLGASWAKQWELRGQFTGYSWAARELELRLQGVLVRGVSILKTKYETAQAIVNCPDWKISEWVAHRDFLIAKALDAYHNGYWEPAHDETCNEYGGCAFKPLCQIPPERRDNWIRTSYEFNDWNPLNTIGDL